MMPKAWLGITRVEQSSAYHLAQQQQQQGAADALVVTLI
jgi:hypothetical protein